MELRGRGGEVGHEVEDVGVAGVVQNEAVETALLQRVKVALEEHGENRKKQILCQGSLSVQYMYPGRALQWELYIRCKGSLKVE